MSMVYESLSTVVVLVIVVIIMAGWLPARTVKGMKKVAEHREDRYSPSLHLVDQDSGTRFSDEHTPQAKGIIMQPDHMRDAKYSSEHIAHVRQLRHAAIRRRRIIVISLLAITVLVLGISFPLKFSPLFALIPAALMVLVLALGVRAAAQARAWERRVAAARSRRRAGHTVMQSANAVRGNAAAAGAVSPNALPEAERGEALPAGVREQGDGAAVHEDPDTSVMEQREIRRVLRQAREEQAKALAEREAQRSAAVAASSAGTGDSAVDAVPAGEVSAADVAADDDASGAVRADAAADVPAVADETSELDHVSPARAMDAFDMAISQDLISFSLGAPRNGDEIVPAAPESLEIKSTRQVAKAVPPSEPEAVDVSSADVSPAEAPSSAVDVPASEVPTSAVPAANDVPMSDTAAFHNTELTRDVEAPEATAESLGTGLDTILARRSS